MSQRLLVREPVSGLHAKDRCIGLGLLCPGGQMFVQYVRATAIGVGFACAAGFAATQENQFHHPTIYDDGYEDGAPPSTEDTYIADPAESFVVEHSNSVAVVAPRPAPPATRCREYTTDAGGGADNPYERGLACPQADGSWRIVSGADPLDERPMQEARADSRPYADYTDEEPDYRDVPRPLRRFRLDWNAWRRDSDRSARGRFNE